MTPPALLALWVASCGWWLVWMRAGLVLLEEWPVAPQLEPQVLAAMRRREVGEAS